MTHRLLLHLLFFVSGSAGLIYEVVWVRQFGYVFGSTVYSVAVVTGLFMFGLGLGGWTFGRFADARFREDAGAPLRWYARLELCIAAAALGVALALPRLELLSGAFSSYVVDPGTGWHHLSLGSSMLRYGVALLLVGPLTIAMGGTLPLLIRYVVALDLDLAGWRIGALYAINTAGAALGCLLTDLALVPTLGVLATQGIAVGLNVAAGLGALALARSAPAGPGRRGAEAREAAGEGAAPRTLGLACVAVLLTGFASMGMQVVWFRHLVSLFGSYRAVFSLLLTVILCGLWLGSLVGGWLARSRLRPAAAYASAQACFVVAALAALWLAKGEIGANVGAFFHALSGPLEPDVAFRVAVHAAIGFPLLGVVGLPSLFMGVAFPLANASVQRRRAEVGHRAGTLYLANTVGGVAGSFAAGFLLLPAAGIQTSALLLVACAAASLVPLAAMAGAPGRGRGPVFLAAGAACVLALGAWLRLPVDFLVERTVSVGRGERVLKVSEGVNETIAILEEPGGFRTLMTNGHSMSGTRPGSQRFMRAFAHVPLLLHEEPRRAMVMCFGVGTTLHATLLHPSIEEVELVDYSEHVLRHAPWFETNHRGAPDDPRVRVFVNDARQHLRMVPEASYDFITGEPPPIAYAGVVTLYTREFFRLARSRLRPGGLLSYWFPIHQVSGEVGLAVVGAFLEVFPDAVLLSGYRQSLILLGSAGPGPLRIHPARLTRRVETNPELARDLERIWLTPLELIGSFAAPSETLRAATRGVTPISDSHPALEYGAVFFEREVRRPADLFAATAAEDWCPSCFEDKGSPISAAELRAYLEVMQRYYASEDFLRGRPNRAPRPFPLTPREREQLAQSRYLRHLAGGRSP